MSRLSTILALAVGAAVPSPTSDWRTFLPAGWESGDCPASYGPQAVLCAGTDTGPFKVDRHVPTVMIEIPGTSCAEAESALVARYQARLSVARRASGQCGPAHAPCTELRFKDSRTVDPISPLVYVVCPASGPVGVVSYVLSAKSMDRFEPLARTQAAWQPRAP